ncbi:MAG: mechanosensitive ion channel domain-containing protein [Pseudomonadota bacterium]
MPAETAKADPVAPLTRALDAAVSGDPEMLRGLATVMAAFSVRIVVAVIILAITLWAAKRVARVTERGMARFSRHTPADKTLADFVSALVKYVIIAIGLIAVLQQLGVQTTSVLAVLGAASLAIGLALQGTLGNVAAGVMILLQRPYRVGDRVELNGRQGVVSGLDLFNTRLLDYDGLTVYLPNGKVFGDMIVNVSQAGRRRIDLVFGVDYEDDLDVALELLLSIAGEDPRVLSSPAPWSKVTALADSSVSVNLRCWTTPDDWMDTRFDLVKRVKEAFEAHGLSFPYPHQVMAERRQRPREGGDATA